MAKRTKKMDPMTDAEKKAIRDAANSVWSMVCYDIMQSVGKDSIPASHVVEIVMDASRLEEEIGMRVRMRNKRGCHVPLSVVRWFPRSYREANWAEASRTVERFLKREVFTFKRYGL